MKDLNCGREQERTVRLKKSLNRSAVFLALQVLMAIVVLCLQGYLAWSVYQLDESAARTANDPNESWHAYFSRMLRVPHYSAFLSAAICGDELYVLTSNRESHRSKELSFRWSTEVHEVVQFNLVNGRSFRFAAPDYVYDVVSKGSNAFWTNARHNLPYSNPNRGGCFLFDGDPACLKRSITLENCYEVVLLEDYRSLNAKRNPGLFALIPDNIYYDELNIIQHSGETYLLDYEDFGDKIFFRIGLPTGDQNAAEAFAQQLPRRIEDYSDAQLKENGWICIRNKQRDADDVGYPPWGRPFGFWVEGLYPCGIGHEAAETSEKLQFRWCRFQPNNDVETHSVPSPIPWAATDREIFHGSGWLRVVSSPAGQVYVVSSHPDGRLHVLKWEENQLTLVAQCGSPLIYADILEILLYAGLITLLPMCLLGIFVWIIQRFHRPAEYSFGLQTVSLSTGIRRGIARAVDLSIPLSLIAYACFADPNAVGWWHETQSKFDYLDCDFAESFTYPLMWIQFGLPTWFEFFFTLLSVPLCWLPLLLAIVFFITQTAWQARTGFTFGKWLMGIRVVQTSLRPCGLARSFLREILLVVDSTLLLSWVPGVMFMLATKQHQRLGDLLADTIVIDARQREDQS